MGLQSKKGVLCTVLVNLSRLVLALVLVFSGFVKAVDPKGTMYKLQEYADAFSIELFSADWLLFFAIVLATVEFLIGVFLFLGVYRRTVSMAVFGVFLLFTPFTLYVAISDAVSDCGCFGDAIGMSNWESFFKNLFLFLLSLAVFMGRRRFVFGMSVKNRWMAILFSAFYISVVQGISLSYIPILDFRNYAVGNNLRELVQGEPDTYRVLLTYEKNGEKREFAQDSLPDSTWLFVESRSELVSEGRKPVIGDFAILDWESDYDMAEDILADTGFVFMMVAESLDEASVGRVDRINDLYDYCSEHDLCFCAATSSDEDDIQLWRKRTGAEYPIYWADYMLLRNIVRANPGMVLMKDGVIVGKWNVGNMPDVGQMMSQGGSERLAKNAVYGIDGMVFWSLLFILPLLVIVLLDLATGHRKKLAKTEPVDEVDTVSAEKNNAVE